MSELMGKICGELPEVLEELKEALDGKVFQHDKIVEGLEKLVKQGMFKSASHYVISIEECPSEIKRYFLQLENMQKKYDDELNHYSQYRSLTPCFDGD